MNYTIEKARSCDGLYFGEFLLKENELVYIYGTGKNFIMIPLSKMERYLDPESDIEGIEDFMNERYISTLRSSKYLPNPFENLIKYDYIQGDSMFKYSEPNLNSMPPIMNCAFQ